MEPCFGVDNSADPGNGGMTISELQIGEQGELKSTWPLQPFNGESKEPSETIEHATTLAAIVLWNHFSIFSNLVNAVMFCLRFGRTLTGEEKLRATE